MTEELKQELRVGLTHLGLSPTEQAVEQLSRYCDLLLEKNQVMNLTAITDPAQVVKLHFLDSAALLPTKALTGKKIIDVGTGAGFPGLVLKILDPTIRLTLLDTLGKRMDWLEEVAGELGLEGITFCKGRAEELSHRKEHRDQYDAAVSRALASMPMLAELCMPYVKKGGLFFAMKSNKTDDPGGRGHHRQAGRGKALCHGLSGPRHGGLPPDRDGLQGRIHPQGLPSEVDEDERSE